MEKVALERNNGGSVTAEEEEAGGRVNETFRHARVFGERPPQKNNNSEKKQNKKKTPAGQRCWNMLEYSCRQKG